MKKVDQAHDHWHRHGDDPGRPYRFTGADRLLVDFGRAVRAVLAERGVGDAVIEGGRDGRSRIYCGRWRSWRRSGW